MIFAFLKGKKSRLKAIGDMTSLMTLLTIISNSLSDKLTEQKGISKEKAQEAVIKCIEYGFKSKEDFEVTNI